jgi:hypothetical protein
MLSRRFRRSGTALGRAHRLIRRMSEDIDLKIVSDKPFTRVELRNLRDVITKSLLEVGFAFDPTNEVHRKSGNASRYTIYRLPYAPIADGQGSLRPEIQIETAVWPLRRSVVELPVISFIAEAFNRPAEVPAIPCVALVETVAEKFVALTRRAGAELNDAGGPRDSTLVRHIYDLHTIRAYYDPIEVASLASEIMLADAVAYGHQFPAYRENPTAETIRAVAGIENDPGFARRYTTFLRDMVYGEVHEFGEAISTIRVLADRLFDRT